MAREPALARSFCWDRLHPRRVTPRSRSGVLAPGGRTKRSECSASTGTRTPGSGRPSGRLRADRPRSTHGKPLREGARIQWLGTDAMPRVPPGRGPGQSGGGHHRVEAAKRGTLLALVQRAVHGRRLRRLFQTRRGRGLRLRWHSDCEGRSMYPSWEGAVRRSYVHRCRHPGRYSPGRAHHHGHARPGLGSKPGWRKTSRVLGRRRWRRAPDRRRDCPIHRGLDLVR